ncbi:FAD-dependent oxidoreductase, partial [Listeria monocytogenes]|nr:FAD-dependent oxidoreductase [Listeria monocytogenes]
VATGSKPQTLPGLEPDGERVFTSDEAIEMKALPKSIVIIGGGAIGIEWASMFADVDVEVTVLEYAETILPREDREIAREMTRFLKKKGVQVITGARVLPETLSKNGGVTIKAVINDEEQSFQAEKMLVSVGRQAAIDGIGLENTNIKLEKG